MATASTSCAAVRVDLARAALQPGETLTGTVHLNASQAMPSATLTVHVVGHETFHWRTAWRLGLAGYKHVMEHLNEEIVLAEDVEIREGDSLYPFSFQLPEDLQYTVGYSSRIVEELRSVRVGVEYEVNAALSVTGCHKPCIKCKAPFCVVPLPMAVPFGRRVSAITEEAVKLMGVFDRGKCRIALSMDTDVLEVSSTIEARVILPLQMVCALKYVALALYEDVTVDRYHRLSSDSRRVRYQRVDKAAIPAPNAINGDSTVLTIYRVAVEFKFPMVPRVKAIVPVTVLANGR